MQDETFLKGMGLIQATFNLHPSETQTQMWHILLKDIGDREFEAAIMHLCRTGEKLFDNENVAAILRKIVDDQHLSAEEAWGKVQRMVVTEGSWGNPKWEDEAISLAINSLGGWKYICSVENKDLGTMRAHFYRTFEACQKRIGLQETSKMIEASAVIKGLVKEIGKMIPDTTSSK